MREPRPVDVRCPPRRRDGSSPRSRWPLARRIAKIGLRPLAESGPGRRGKVDGGGPGLRAEERRRRPKSCSLARRTRRTRTSRPVVREAIARPRGSRRPASAHGPAAARPRVSQADELGRLARRRQGRLPVRPAHSLDRGPARRRVVPFTIYELVEGARGASLVESGRATRGHRFLPRGAAGGPLDVRVASPTSRDSCARASCSLDPTTARQAHRGGARRGRRRPARPRARAGGGMARSGRVPRRSSSGTSPRVPQRCRCEVRDTVLAHHQKYLPLRRAARGRRASPR